MQTDWGSIVMLRSGAVVRGAPQHDAEQAEIAVRLGYGADVLAMVQDHDPLHVLLCDWLGLPDSQSLRCAAGFEFDAAVADAEEQAVMAVQRLLRCAGRSVRDVTNASGVLTNTPPGIIPRG